MNVIISVLVLLCLYVLVISWKSYIMPGKVQKNCLLDEEVYSWVLKHVKFDTFSDTSNEMFSKLIDYESNYRKTKKSPSRKR